MATKAHLDTHIALWLHDTLEDKFSSSQINCIETCDLFISEFVRLELYYLHEIGRIRIKPPSILSHLAAHAEVTLSSCPLHVLMNEAVKYTWTRDPFDRLITANASVEKAVLLTRDERILTHCHLAVG